jgi:hypothetical protein
MAQSTGLDGQHKRPWLGTRRWSSSCAMTKSWKWPSWSTRSLASVMIPADEQDPHFRRISWMRMTLGLTRSFTAQARAWRRSSRDLVDALRWVWKHHAHPQRPVDKDKS